MEETKRKRHRPQVHDDNTPQHELSAGHNQPAFGLPEDGKAVPKRWRKKEHLHDFLLHEVCNFLPESYGEMERKHVELKLPDHDITTRHRHRLHAENTHEPDEQRATKYARVRALS